MRDLNDNEAKSDLNFQQKSQNNYSESPLLRKQTTKGHKCQHHVKPSDLIPITKQDQSLMYHAK